MAFELVKFYLVQWWGLEKHQVGNTSNTAKVRSTVFQHKNETRNHFHQNN